MGKPLQIGLGGDRTAANRDVDKSAEMVVPMPPSGRNLESLQGFPAWGTQGVLRL
jgi:hypothetical protein